MKTQKESQHLKKIIVKEKETEKEIKKKTRNLLVHHKEEKRCVMKFN